MTLELTLLIWLAAILYASGCLDNLPQRVSPLARWVRPVRTTKTSNDRTGRTSPRFNLMRARGKADHATPRVVGRPFYMDTVEMEWRNR